mmetsp:Transcript_8981/g.27402  ORF Transcript_8981/g.27402 Transcript_8981/m.27402 type:complete len:239 (+) Transcript_8981:405-1121(+)
MPRRPNARAAAGARCGRALQGVSEAALIPAEAQLVDELRDHDEQPEVRVGQPNGTALRHRRAAAVVVCARDGCSGRRPCEGGPGLLFQAVPHHLACGPQLRLRAIRRRQHSTSRDAKLHPRLVEPPTTLRIRAATTLGLAHVPHLLGTQVGHKHQHARLLVRPAAAGAIGHEARHEASERHRADRGPTTRWIDGRQLHVLALGLLEALHPRRCRRGAIRGIVSRCPTLLRRTGPATLV